MSAIFTVIFAVVLLFSMYLIILTFRSSKYHKMLNRYIVISWTIMVFSGIYEAFGLFDKLTAGKLEPILLVVMITLPFIVLIAALPRK